MPCFARTGKRSFKFHVSRSDAEAALLVSCKQHPHAGFPQPGLAGVQSRPPLIRAGDTVTTKPRTSLSWPAHSCDLGRRSGA